MWEGYIEYGGNEVINVARTEAYAKNAGLPWFKPQYNNDSLPAMLGDTYISPSLDLGVPWVDPTIPESFDFYGAYPLGVTGVEDSTRTSTLTQNVGDGAFVTGLRHGSKSPVFNVVLVGESDAACAYGMTWLKQTLLTGQCGTGLPPLCYLASEPQVDLGSADLVWVTTTDDDDTDLDGGIPTDIGGVDLDDGSPFTDGDEPTGPDDDGGTPSDAGGGDLDGGTPTDVGGTVLDGGGPSVSVVDLDGGGPFRDKELMSIQTNPADCLPPLMRSLHQVQINSGPSVVAKYDMSSGGAAWNVTFSGVAQEAWEYGVEVGVLEGFLDPGTNDPWVGGLPTGAAIDTDGAVFTEVPCGPVVLGPLEDPLCPVTIAPPLPPSVSLGCFELPVNWRRRQVSIPADFVPLWGEVVPKFEVHARAADVRYLRVRFYADPQGNGITSDDPCAYCGDIVISYIPKGNTLTFDASERACYVTDTMQRRRRADAVVSAADGSPFDWPVLTCGVPYIVTLDLPQTQHPPVFDLSFYARAA